MKYKFSQHAITVMDARDIRREWVESVIQYPSLKIEKSSTEINLFSPIEENENRCLKVVINPLYKIVVTVYFDRNMRKKGCK